MKTLLGTLRILNQQKIGGKGDAGCDQGGQLKGRICGEKKGFEFDAEAKVRSLYTPMVTPTFCMNSPVLPEVLTTEAIGLQSLLPDAEYRSSCAQLSLRSFAEKRPEKKHGNGLSLLEHMSQKGDIHFPLKRYRECRPSFDGNLAKKLKTDSCKSLMLPQNTPPLNGGKVKPAVLGIRPLERGDKSMLGGAGSSCHQCKSRRALHKLFFCSNQGLCTRLKDKRNLCRKKYCDQCLDKFYHETPPEKIDLPKWLCPACRSLCCCAACRRQRAKLDEDQPMSPATSLACGLVFGDMLDGKDQLTLEEAQASVTKGVQKMNDMVEKQHAKNAKPHSKLNTKTNTKPNNKTHPKQHNKSARIRMSTIKATKAAKTAKNKAAKSPGRKNQSRKQTKKMSASKTKAKPKPKSKAKTKQVKKAKKAIIEITQAAQSQPQVVTAQLWSVATAAAAAQGWLQIQQQHKARLLAKLKTEPKKSQPLQAQLVGVPGASLQRGFIIPA
ncbi:hypothetical protein AAMO2058_000295600 [Amorphochlora amoebiformis]